MAAKVAKARPDPTRALFEALAARGRAPLLSRSSGTVRFELAEGRRVETWSVTIEKGNVTVSRDTGDADTVVRTTKALFDDLATGKQNGMAALLRGAIAAEGNLSLLVQLERLFPGPPRTRAFTARLR
jgi:putative sterol carrier protein